MDGQVIRARVRESLQQTLGVFDHQVNVQRQFGGAAAGFHDDRPHGQVGDKMAVHHIHVDPVGAGRFTGGDLLPQAQEVRRQDGGGNDHSLHGMAGL